MAGCLTFLAKNQGAGLFPVRPTDRVGNSDQMAGDEKVYLHRPFAPHSHIRFFPSLVIKSSLDRATIMNVAVAATERRSFVHSCHGAVTVMNNFHTGRGMMNKFHISGGMNKWHKVEA